MFSNGTRTNKPMIFFLFVTLSVLGYFLVTWIFRDDVFSAVKCTFINDEVSRAIAKCERLKEVKTALEKELTLIMKYIVKARRYARSGKTLLELRRAYTSLDKLVREVNMQYIKETASSQLKEAFEQEQSVKTRRNRRGVTNLENGMVNTDSGELPPVCPEVFNDTLAGYYLYTKGWHRLHCNSVPFHKTVTILLYYQSNSRFRIEKLLQEIRLVYPSLTVMVAVDKSKKPPTADFIKSLRMNIEVINVISDKVGAVWNQLIKKVKTPYALIARNIEKFTNHVNLERHVDVAYRHDIDIVGGSYRTPNGHWSHACRQSALQNYTLTYLEGYDLSRDSCLYCEHLNSPFVVKTRTIKFLFPFDESLSNEMIFEDLFLQMKQKDMLIMSCPDSMFFVQDTETVKEHRSTWISLVAKWEVNKIHLTNGNTLSYSCVESKSKCDARRYRYRGMALPVCCMESLSHAMNLLMKACDDYKIICEIDTGNVIGSVKFYGILPWERDGDIVYDSRNHTVFRTIQSVFTNVGYKFEEETEPKSGSGGYFALRVPGWRIELWGMPKAGSEDLIREGLNVTRIQTDGYWHQAPPSPGAFARNRYGYEIFKHSQHWQTLNMKDSWVIYQPGSYPPCPRPGHHACLDNLLADGNIQFMGPWI